MKKSILIISCITICLSLKGQNQTVSGDLDITGNVGIGISSPNYKLDVNGTIGVNGHFTSLRSSSNTFLRLNDDGYTGYGSASSLSSGANILLYGKTSSRADNLAFRNSTGEKMTIISNGYIGIGTENPSTKLEISSDKTKFITLQRDGLVKKGHIGYGAANGGGIYLGTDDTPYGMYVQQDGKIGIGTYSPSTKLEISSDKTKFITLQRDGVVKKGHIGYGAGNGGSIYLGTEDTPYGIYLQQNGNVGIGTYNPDETLSVNGKIHTKEVKVDLNGWSDFVFDKAYDLPTLEEVENHINTKGHLIDVPSEEDVLENGILLGEMNAKLLQKIEELTLYTIEQEKQLSQQQMEISLLQNQNKVIEEQAKDIEELKALVNQLLKE